MSVSLLSTSLVPQSANLTHYSKGEDLRISFPDAFFTPNQDIGHLQVRFLRAIKKEFPGEKANLHYIRQILLHQKPEGMLKPSGYLSRLFSTESWDEWTESKTELGRVVSLFENFLENGYGEKTLVKRLNPLIIKKADEQAKTILAKTDSMDVETCPSKLALGAIATLATHNPIPIGLAAFSCVTPVQAIEDPVKFNNQIILEPGDVWSMDAHHKIVLCKKSVEKKCKSVGFKFKVPPFVPVRDTVICNEPIRTCNYHGPQLHVTIVNRAKESILYDGPFGGDQEFNTAYKCDTLFDGYAWCYEELWISIENKSNESAAMYVFVE